jgi:hypothetical protein
MGLQNVAENSPYIFNFIHLSELFDWMSDIKIFYLKLELGLDFKTQSQTVLNGAELVLRFFQK